MPLLQRFVARVGLPLLLPLCVPLLQLLVVLLLQLVLVPLLLLILQPAPRLVPRIWEGLGGRLQRRLGRRRSVRALVATRWRYGPPQAAPCAASCKPAPVHLSPLLPL